MPVCILYIMDFGVDNEMVKVCNRKVESMAGDQITKYWRRMYSYAISRISLQLSLYGTSKRHLYKRLMIKLRMLKYDICIKCLKLLIEITFRRRMMYRRMMV